MRNFPDISDIVRTTLQRKGLLPQVAGRKPAHTIPARYWPTPNTMFFGYLDVYEGKAAGGAVSYEVAFRVAPLGGQKPKFDVRVEPEGANHGR